MQFIFVMAMLFMSVGGADLLRDYNVYSVIKY